MCWHASDHRQSSNVKWLWIEVREQREDSTTRSLDQSGASGAGRATALFWELSRRLSRPGQPLATCSSPKPAWIITFHSVIFHHGSLQTDNWASREAPRSGVPPSLQIPSEREREMQRESERKRENPCTLHWKGWRRMDKTTLSVDLKRRLMAAMKKSAFRRREEWICLLMHTQWDVR